MTTSHPSIERQPLTANDLKSERCEHCGTKYHTHINPFCPACEFSEWVGYNHVLKYREGQRDRERQKESRRRWEKKNPRRKRKKAVTK